MLPERDLSANEIDAFGGLALLMGTGLYEAADEPPTGSMPGEAELPAPADISPAPDEPRTSGKRKRK